VPADLTPPGTSPGRPQPAPADGDDRSSTGAVAAALRRGVDAIWAPTPVAMRRIALAGVVSTAVIIVTGAAVRLSKSGLGCPDWPQCTRSSLVAARTRGDPMFHTWIEFGNRMMTVAVTVVAVAVLVAAWRFRPQGRRRADLVWLAAAQPAGVVAQIVLGGIVVLTNLNPAMVSVHFVVSLAVVAAALALHAKCTEGTGPPQSLIRADLRVLVYGVVAVAAVMLAAGTVVTGTGPLAGAGAVPRYHLPLTGVTQFHSDIGWLMGGLTLPLVVGLRLTRAPVRVMRLGWLLLGLLLVQGAVGYTQYFTGLPAGLVWVHVSGSLLIWMVALRLMFAARDRGPLMQPPDPADGPGAVSAARTGPEPQTEPAPAR
jgi:cytochrome c oxidase assembly protein subunit 15